MAPVPPHDHDRLVAALGVCSVCIRGSNVEATARANPEADDPPGTVILCHLCSEAVNLNDPRLHRLVSGWSRYRGATGGTNALRARREHHRYAHGECLDRAKAGLLNQPPLELDDL